MGMLLSTRRALLYRPPAAGGNWWEVAGQTCVAAYQPKGAADYATSKINLANPGTYDMGDGAAYPTWDTGTGWTFNGSTQYLRIASAVVSTVPLTFIARVTPASLTANTILAAITRENSTGDKRYNSFLLEVRGAVAGDYLSAATIGGGTAPTVARALTTAGASTSSLIGCAVFSAANSRTAYINAGNAGNETTSVTPEPLDTTTIGVASYWAIGSVIREGYFAGSIAAVAIYSGALSAGEVASLTTTIQGL